MRLTPNCLAEFKFDFKKHFWWGKGWGHKPDKNIRDREFKKIWKYEGRRVITELPAVLPEGVVAEDANEYVRRCMTERIPDFILPWPYNRPGIKGEQSDPNYHERTALVFHRLRKMLDPLNQALVFTNCICEDENNLPNILDCFSNIKFDEDFSDLIDRRINWCKSSDGALLKLPKTRLFPYLDQNPTRRYGIPPTRKEFNLMNTFHDLAETFIAKKYGYTNLHKLFYPYSLIPIERDDKLIILDLECDFITMQKQSFSMPLFSSSPLLTVEKPLVSIHPLNWTTCFSHKNVYSDQWYFELLPSHNVQTIYLSQNDLKQLTNETLAGRAIMFCYGYTLGQTRKMYGDNINSKELPDPITIQCVYHNNSDFSFGFVCFQLNTTSFDSSLKNQVWLSGPFTDYKEILKNFIAFQLNGFIDISTQKLKNLEMKSN